MRKTAQWHGLGCAVSGAFAAVVLAIAPAGLTGAECRDHAGRLLPARDKDEKANKQRELKAPGNVEAYEEARLFARITGYVKQWNVDIGDRVKKGQVLAVLSVPEREAEYAQKRALVVQSQAEVQQAQGMLKEATVALDLVSSQIQEAEAGVKQAQAQLRYRQLNYERMKELLKSSAIDEKVFKEATAHLEAAKAALVQAEARLRVTKAARDSAATKRDTAAAGVQVAKARFDVARSDLQRVAALLNYSRILAPLDGVVTSRSINTGDLAAPPRGRAVPLFTVAQLDIVRVFVAVPDTAVNRLRVGMAASIKIDAFPGKVFEGKVTRTSHALDRAKRTLRAEIDLPNPDGRLLPGMYGTVKLMLGRD